MAYGGGNAIKISPRVKCHQHGKSLRPAGRCLIRGLLQAVLPDPNQCDKLVLLHAAIRQMVMQTPDQRCSSRIISHHSISPPLQPDRCQHRFAWNAHSTFQLMQQ